MKVHVLGICGTLMGSIALLAKQKGYEVSGSDSNSGYPPMSTQLELHNIPVAPSYDLKNFPPELDYSIVGNALIRGMPIIENLLTADMPFISGPQWLAEYILRDRLVIAVAGTHGKTTTASILTWILEYTGKKPGFLIGGIPENFSVSAHLGEGEYFVIEGDEYCTAFFDMRAKFIHYHPQILILNNIEYDHADLFDNLDEIKREFHALIKTMPGNGLIIANADDANLSAVLNEGCWTKVTTFGNHAGRWRAEIIKSSGSSFKVYRDAVHQGTVEWDLLGQHNVTNALSALVAAEHVGIPIQDAITALKHFKGVKRRLERIGCVNGVTVYDDFAHHPTAIATTLAGLRAKVGAARILVVFEFSSYTMKHGLGSEVFKEAFKLADILFCKQPNTQWNFSEIAKDFFQPVDIFPDITSLIQKLLTQVTQGDHVVIMSCAGFDNIHQKILAALQMEL